MRVCIQPNYKYSSPKVCCSQALYFSLPQKANKHSTLSNESRAVNVAFSQRAVYLKSGKSALQMGKINAAAERQKYFQPPKVIFILNRAQKNSGSNNTNNKYLGESNSARTRKLALKFAIWARTILSQSTPDSFVCCFRYHWLAVVLWGRSQNIHHPDENNTGRRCTHWSVWVRFSNSFCLMRAPLSFVCVRRRTNAITFRGTLWIFSPVSE